MRQRVKSAKQRNFNKDVNSRTQVRYHGRFVEDIDPRKIIASSDQSYNKNTNKFDQEMEMHLLKLQAIM